MNATTKKIHLIAIASALLGASQIHAQTPAGQWDFNSSNLVATVGTDLVYADGPGGPTQTGTRFGSATNFGLPTINGTDAIVMQFPTATNGMGYLMTAPINPNGGGSLVNEWTLIMDVLYPAASDGKVRPLVDTDGAIFTAGPDFIVSDSNGLGSPPGGPYFGSIQPNTWYRIGISVTATQVSYYINGAQVGTTAGAGLDNRFGFTAGGTSLLLGSTLNAAAAGYVNSVQLRDVALSSGQMQALGGPSASGVPQTIPPVPAFIDSRTPGVSATAVGPSPDIHVVLNQGDSTVTSSSIKLYLDGALLNATVNPTAPTFDITASVTTLLDPASVHALSLAWQDSMSGSVTSTWSFTVCNYQNVTLPTPIYLETFDEVAEGGIPAGWTVTNWTDTLTAGLNLFDTASDSYKDWVTISTGDYTTVYPDTDDYTTPGMPNVTGNRRLMIPPIVLNGQLLSGLAQGNLIVAESDQRGSSQVQVMFTSDYNLTGHTNVYLAFNNINEQNQDNICSVEYSIDQGATWLPLLYMLDDGTTDGNGSDVVTNSSTGKIDVAATFGTPRSDQAHGLAFSNYIGAAVSTNLIPFIRPCRNDDPVQQKRIEVFRLPQADNQAHVRFRLGQAGTGSWYFSVDNFGLYTINTPIILTPPKDQTVSAGGTASFSVTAQSATPLTYRWKHAGTNITDAGHFSGTGTATLTVSNCETNEAGTYACVVGNADGNVTTTPARLTVVTAPVITTQPAAVITSAGVPVSFTVSALGRQPLTYYWTRSGSAVGANSSALSFAAVQISDAGSYQVTVSNAEGFAASVPARLIVSPSSITASLVVHLKFDGNYTDSSGRGNNASAVGNPTFAPGKFGQALSFTTKQDGSEFDYATLGYPNDLKFGANVDFSVSFWVNYTQQVDDPPFISNKDWNSSNNPGWGLFTQGNGHFRVNTTGTGGTKYDLGSGSTPLVRDGTWHNIIMIHARGAWISVYTDGVLTSTRADLTTGSIDTDGLGYNVNIGQDGTGQYTDNHGAGITNALIDDVGIWTRPLSSQEAVAIYAAGQSGKDLSQAAVSVKVTLVATKNGSNLVLTWPGAANVKLQTTPSLSTPVWSDVSGTLGASTATMPITSTLAFFRLATQ